MYPLPHDKERKNRRASAQCRSQPRLSRVERRYDNSTWVNRQKAGWNFMLSSWRVAT
jgi:hypothetical protein